MPQFTRKFPYCGRTNSSTRLYGTNFMQIHLLPRYSTRISYIIPQLMCVSTVISFQVIQWSLVQVNQLLQTRLSNTFANQSFKQVTIIHTLSIFMVLMSHPESFKPFKDMCMGKSFISIYIFKYFMCFSRYFPEFETKPVHLCCSMTTKTNITHAQGCFR